MLMKKSIADYLIFETPLPEDPGQQRAQVEIDSFLTLLNQAMGPGMPEAVADVIRNLAEHSGEIERGIVVWVRLIEVLIQNAERTGASGELKKADVKSAAHYLIQENRVEFPGLPRYLQPVILDLAVDWIIDTLVAETNRYNLWTPEPPEQPSFASFVRMAAKRFKLWTRPFWDFAARILAKIYLAIRYSEPLSPEVKRAVDAVEKQGFLIDKRSLMRAGMETVIFVGQHGEQVIAIFRLAFEAVKEAETFSELSGPEKKQYAMDVILAVLGELGFPVDNGLIGAIIRSFADAAIESAVDIFSRRAPELFHPHGEAAAGLPSGDALG